MKPQRVQMSRKRPWRVDHPDAVIVARPSRWGNPYRVTPERTRAQAVESFRAIWNVNTQPHDWFTELNEYPTRDDVRRMLRGRDLACWCPLDQPCHADVLLEIANEARP